MGPALSRLQAAAQHGLTRFVGRDAEIDVPRRLLEGALGSLVVSGDERPDLFRSLSPEIARRHSRH